MFCPKCGALLVPKKEGNKKVMACSCGYSETAETGGTMTEKVEEEGEVEVVKEDSEMLPTMEIKCPKCGNNTAHYMTAQTRAGDEPETKIMKCTKCKHTWRDYS